MYYCDYHKVIVGAVPITDLAPIVLNTQ
jgi:hypothetical protein